MKRVNAFAWMRFRYDDGNDAQLLLTRILTSVTNDIQIVQLINAIPPLGWQGTIERIEKAIAASVRFIVYAPLFFVR